MLNAHENAQAAINGFSAESLQPFGGSEAKKMALCTCHQELRYPKGRLYVTKLIIIFESITIEVVMSYAEDRMKPVSPLIKAFERMRVFGGEPTITLPKFLGCNAKFPDEVFDPTM